MAVTLVTGANGFLGTYAAVDLLQQTDETLAILVRARDRRAALEKLWHGWQLLLTPEAFAALLPRLHLVPGDLHAPGLGLAPDDLAWLEAHVDSVLHGAASLNRKSEKACLNTNVRGTLSVLELARRLRDARGLRRLTFVSTVAVAGHRAHEDVGEDESIDWERSDYDPYARTKKLCEHLVRTLLPGVPTVVVRPSIAMGDPVRTATTQFDMVFATSMLYDLRVLPLAPTGRVDIANADWVGRSIGRLHHKPTLAHDTYHLSAGRRSPTIAQICEAIDATTGRTTRFAPQLEWAWDKAYRTANRAPRGTTARGLGSLWKVFWPYVTYDTVFLADRVEAELGEAATPFVDYAGALYGWVKAHRFTYPHVPLPEGIA